MAEPFSIGAGVVSVVVPAIHGLRLLLQDIENIKDAPKSIKVLTEALKSVEAGLSLLQNINEREWSALGEAVGTEAQRTIVSCTKACEQFRTTLANWTKLSSEGKLHWRDRTKIGLLKQGQIKAMSGQMQNCHQAIVSIVSIANLYSSVRHSRMTEDIRKDITAAQGNLANAITTTDRDSIVLQSRVEDIENESEDEEAGGAREVGQVGQQDDKAEALRSIAEANGALSIMRKLLEELLAKAKEEEIAKVATGQGSVITTTFGAHNSGYQVGVVYGGVSGLNFGGTHTHK